MLIPNAERLTYVVTQVCWCVSTRASVIHIGSVVYAQCVYDVVFCVDCASNRSMHGQVLRYTFFFFAVCT